MCTHGGVLGVLHSAKAIVTSSVFQNVNAYTIGGAMVVRGGGAEIFVTSSIFNNCEAAIGNGAMVTENDASLHLNGGKNQFISNNDRSIVWSASDASGSAFILFDECPPGKFQPSSHEMSGSFSSSDFVGCPGQCPPGSTTPGHNFAENRFVDANTACTVTCPLNQNCVACPKGRSNDGSSAGLTSEDQCLSPPESVYIVRVMGPSTIEVIVKLPTGVDNEIANVTHFYFATLSGNFTSEVTESGRYAIQVPEAKCDLDSVTVHSCNEYGCSVHSSPIKYDPSMCVLECSGGSYAGTVSCIACLPGPILGCRRYANFFTRVQRVPCRNI